MRDQDLLLMQQAVRGTVPPEIVVAEARMRAAQLTADVSTLDALIADDLLFTGPDGQLGTKAADLAAHAAGAVRVQEHEPQELRARPLGAKCVITALRAWMAVEVGGRLVSGVYRYTRVWAREGEKSWQVVGGHVAQVPVVEQTDHSSVTRS